MAMLLVPHWTRIWALSEYTAEGIIDDDYFYCACQYGHCGV